MQPKCKFENRMHKFFNTSMKRLLECILMQKSCWFNQVFCKIFKSWKFNLNQKNFAQKKLNFWLLNAVCICQKTSTGSGGWVSQKYAWNPYILQISVGLKLINFSLSPFSRKLSSAQFPFQNQRRLGKLRVTPTSTYFTVLGTYATISLQSILATCTEYLRVWQRIPS